MSQRIILPMAGHGKRFAEAGYTSDKPLIEVNGKTLLEWSLDCIPRTWQRIGILRAEQRDPDLEELFLHKYGQYLVHHLLYLPGSTRGAAMTVLSAALALPPEAPVAVMNCDQYFECDLDAVTGDAMARGWDGYILTFGEGQPWPGPAWSYAVCDAWDQVTEVVEKPKTAISEHATVGFYWWRRAGDLVLAICEMIAKHITVNGEYYLAPAYNRILTDEHGRRTNRIVKVVPVQHFVGLGTPEQVRSFEQAALVREP